MTRLVEWQAFCLNRGHHRTLSSKLARLVESILSSHKTMALGSAATARVEEVEYEITNVAAKTEKAEAVLEGGGQYLGEKMQYGYELLKQLSKKKEKIQEKRLQLRKDCFGLLRAQPPAATSGASQKIRRIIVFTVHYGARLRHPAHQVADSIRLQAFHILCVFVSGDACFPTLCS